ncbi:MAG: pyridoxal-phosphate dependent enzyme [Nitrospiraceae bacterium]|nr:pyridoxal-phosphate dependent enzyme [Nitrospiraceae bacterium]
MIDLFSEFPKLGDALPHAQLADLPTPVERAEGLGDAVGVDQLYVKRDDVSGKRYGGNKIRKLEFLLGQACADGAAEVMTFGCAGSNHATATAVYAQQVGLRSISMLLPQPNARSVRRNLLLSYHCGAELHAFEKVATCDARVQAELKRHRVETGKEPAVIPAGGSSALGSVGYVNAALELAGQVARGEMAKPDIVYVAAGTCGTAAGLMVGLRAAGLDARVAPVPVTDARFVNAAKMAELATETAALLAGRDPAFPAMVFSADEMGLREGFLGEAYGLYTEESVAAMRLFEDAAHIGLDGTYTGKGAAALIADARAGRLRGKVVLFWNTYNSRDFSEEIGGIDYRNLPRAFHHYFEEEVQPLDR